MVNILFVIFLLENVTFDLIVCFKKGYFNLRKSVFIGIILVSIESLLKLESKKEHKNSLFS